MTTTFNLFHLIATLFLAVSADAFTSHNLNKMRTVTSLSVSREEYLKPHFHTSTATISPLEQRVQDYCDNKGGCDLDEMELLRQEFESVNTAAPSLFVSEEQEGEEEHQPVDLKHHLLRMHQIAKMEEH